MSMRRRLGSLAQSARPSALQGRRCGSTLRTRMTELAHETDKNYIVAGGLLGALAVVKPPLAAGIGALLGAAHVADMAVNDDLDDIVAMPKTYYNRLRGPKEGRKRVVVLGSGWGALSFVRKLDPMEFDITVVSPRNYFFYTPMLAGVSTSTVKSHSVLEAVRQTAPFPHASFVKAECSGVDAAAKRLQCEGGVEIPYDHLLIAVGAQPNTFGIPGVQDHAFFLKELDHSLAVRQRILELLEQADIARLAGRADEISRLLSVVVVGGGPTGVEFAAELADFVATDVQRSFPHVARQLKVTLVEALPGLLPMFNENVGAHIKTHLTNAGVNVRTETMVKRVDEGAVSLKTKDGDVEELNYGALVWVAGIGSRPITRVIASAFGQSNPRGIEVDQCLRVKGSQGNEVFAFGDCAVSGFPLTAQVAAQQGKYLGRSFRLRGGAHTEPFAYKHQGSLAYVGKSEAVAVLAAPKLPEIGGASFWRKLASCPEDWLKPDQRTTPEQKQQKEVSIIGLGGFAIWRGVYFTKLFSYRNRFNVATDWLRALCFGRSVASPVRAPRSPGIL